MTGEDRLHERIDKVFERLDQTRDRLIEEINSLNTRLEKHLAVIDVKEANQQLSCDAHQEALEIMDERVSNLETMRIRLAGFFSGIAFMGGAVGAVVTVLIQLAWKKLIG